MYQNPRIKIINWQIYQTHWTDEVEISGFRFVYIFGHTAWIFTNNLYPKVVKELMEKGQKLGIQCIPAAKHKKFVSLLSSFVDGKKRNCH